MAVGIESEKAAEGLDGADAAGDRRPGTDHILLQAFVCGAAQIGQERLVVQKTAPEHLGNAEHDVAVWEACRDIV